MKPHIPDLTVIICAYNAHRTIDCAIRSILPQLHERAELIVVDDGSTDSTPSILRRFSSHPRFSTITFPSNQGKAAALTEAIQHSESRYYMFCDADDHFLPGAIDTMLQAAISDDADIVFAPYIRVINTRAEIIRPRPLISSLNDMPLNTVHFSLCNKIIRASLVDRFPPYPGIDRWEDLGMIARIMTAAERISFIDTPIYSYSYPPSLPSLSRSPKDITLANRLAIADHLIHYFHTHGLEEQYATFLLHLKFCAKLKLARRPKPTLRRWLSTYPEVNSRILSLRHIPILARLYFRALSLLAPLFPR